MRSVLYRSPRLYKAVRAGMRTANTPVARRRLTRVLASEPRPFKLEIGGIEPRPDWVITNVGAVTKLYLDATVRWPLEDGSLSHVYSDNVIEHISLADGRTMLAEAFRCLVPGGAIRIVTPDIGKHVELYLAGTRSGTEVIPAEFGSGYRELGLSIEHPIDVLRIPIAEFGHHAGYVYDEPTLRAELERAGFTKVNRTDLGTSDYEAMQGLDQRADEGGAQMAVEAVKPG